MAQQPSISVRQPQANDLVDEPVAVCGVATGFEGSISARIRDGRGAELVHVPLQVGANGILANFHASIALPAVPATPRGTLEVFEVSARDGSEINKLWVPIVFGRALIDPFHGFVQYTVARGDTLAAIARQFYADGSLWPRIFEANRTEIADANLIFPGQVLRVPQ